MNRSNVLEIKKTLKITEKDIPSIDTICTCFVNGEKEKLIANTEKYNSLDEEEQYKYIEILKSVLTGTIGKKLINLSYTEGETSARAQSSIEGTYKEMFKNDFVRDEFFTHVIENYDFGENYLLVAGHGIYDVPMKASDGARLEDETETYEFMIAAICPIHSTKAGLTLDTSKGRMVSSKQIQIVEAPVNGFLYPAFNDRQTDTMSMLFYAKKPEEDHKELMEALTGSEAPLSCTTQQNIFENIISEVTDDKADMEIIKNIQENLSELSGSPDNEKITKETIKKVLEESGVSRGKLTDFDHIYGRAGGNEKAEFDPQNLTDLSKFHLKSPDVEIKVKPGKRKLVRKDKINGKNCIIVELEDQDIKVNGIPIE